MESYANILLEDIRESHRTHTEKFMGTPSLGDTFAEIEKGRVQCLYAGTMGHFFIINGDTL